MDRRPLLLNSVLLRQNPHNVVEWQKRVTLLEGKPREIVNTYTEAVQTVDPKQAVGKLFTLWVNFAKFYETNKQINDSRIIFEKATHVAYLKVDELGSVWCEWVEMELRHNHHEEALKLLQRATAPPPRYEYMNEIFIFFFKLIILRYGISISRLLNFSFRKLSKFKLFFKLEINEIFIIFYLKIDYF